MNSNILSPIMRCFCHQYFYIYCAFIKNPLRTLDSLVGNLYNLNFYSSGGGSDFFVKHPIKPFAEELENKRFIIHRINYICNEYKINKKKET